MERLIPVCNQIKDALAAVQLDLGADLPQLCAVGGQSVGKSSLLEGLVGRAFLPTGAGVVTRRPLVLRLAHVAPRDPGGDRAPEPAVPGDASGSAAAAGDDARYDEWGEFGHLPGRRFSGSAFGEELRQEIVRETERLCGKKQVVSATPIVLTISSPRVIDLTLVDLPGLTRVPVGDQPEDIEAQIRGLIWQHISNPRSLILAVVAGNADLATADSLAMAREVDPHGERTLGVVTKLDLVEHGSDVLGVLEGSVYPLRLGFVGVVCRSFKDVQRGKDVRDHLQNEDQFFRSHPKYRAAAHICGVSHLAMRLNRILLDRICEALPDIKGQALQLIHEQEAELQAYGESFASATTRERGALLLDLLSKFAGRFGDAVSGKPFASSHHEPQEQLLGHARIDYIFRDVFARTVRDFDCLSGLSDGEIRVAIRNATGPRASLFVPEAAFELLARRQIAKLQVPALQCAELTFDELQRVLNVSELPEFRRFVHLREQIFGVAREILHKRLEPTSQMIRDMISIELAYINTSHPDFIGSSGALRAAAEAEAAGLLSMSLYYPLFRTLQVASCQAAGGDNYGGARVQDRAAASGQGPEGASAATSAATAATEAPGDTRRPWAWGNANGGPAAGGAPEAPAGGGFFSTLFRRDGRRSTSSSSVADGCAASSPAPSVEEARSAAAATPQPHGPSTVGIGSAGAGGDLVSRQVSTSTCLRLPDITPAIYPAACQPSQRELVEVTIIKRLLQSYLALVRKNIADSVPKAVMCHMVNGLKDDIHSECVARLYKDEFFEQLLREAPDLEICRSKCRERLRALREVVEVTQQVRDCAEFL